MVAIAVLKCTVLELVFIVLLFGLETHGANEILTTSSFSVSPPLDFNCDAHMTRYAVSVSIYTPLLSLPGTSSYNLRKGEVG
ncbi:hypothetical protein EJ08DRAFT_495270 [Tothia fuscella]|uniref:Secreted protein n=1 Tax=Tothia fuscella TaxID=1048955 RepID=A0A9P4NXF7_9PEZI|nr:hypothetical protein EJ08DRAFT_495270 [Tothia fuscella]